MLALFFLLPAPLYFLGPFAILMLLSRPRTPRELVVLALAGAGLAMVLSGNTGMAPALIQAGGIALVLPFGLFSLHPRMSVLARAGLALIVAAAALGIWGELRGFHWGQVEAAFTAMLTEGYRAAPLLFRDPATRAQVERLLEPGLKSAANTARMAPGFFALLGLAGMGLAAVWQHRIAARPTGRAPVPFRRFRFNDHLIWGVIVTLAAMLAPLPFAPHLVVLNLLLVWAGLYACRGLAVFAALFSKLPVLARAIAAVGAVLVYPIALGVCLATGLADTWVDIRGRLLPPASEGVSP